MLTGSRSSEIRRLLLNNYCIDWVIVSHDSRTRSAVKGLPGRFWTSFSESTRRAEVMIVATKRKTHLSRNHVRFVNLLHNPDEPVQAMALMRKLLAMDENSIPLEARAIDVGQVNWGSVVTVPQKDLSDGAWSYTSLGQSELVLVAEKIRLGESGPFAGVAVTGTGESCGLGAIPHAGQKSEAGLVQHC